MFIFVCHFAKCMYPSVLRMQPDAASDVNISTVRRILLDNDVILYFCGCYMMQQKPSYVTSAKEFSTASPQKASSKPSSASKPPESGNSFPKVVIGGIAVGAAVLAAYQAGYIDEILHKERHNSQPKVGLDDEDRTTAHEGAKLSSHMVEEKVLPSIEVRDEVRLNTQNLEQKGETDSVTSTFGEFAGRHVEIQPHDEDKSEATAREDKVLEQEESRVSSIVSNDNNTAAGTSMEESLDRESPNAGINVPASEKIHVSNESSHDISQNEDIVVESPAQQHILEGDRKEVPMRLTNETDYRIC